MRISEARDFLVKYLPKGKRILEVGPPGTGKTDIIMQAAELCGMETIFLSMPVEDPSTIRGYPSKGADGKATHMLFDAMAAAFEATEPTVLVADDLGMATESTLKAFLRFVQFGEINGKQLPKCVTICAATNDVTHGAGVYGLIEPLKSRFHTIIDVETSVDDVVTYGLSRGWPTDLLAFLRNDPNALNDWKPSKSMHIQGGCPRGWGYVAEWINDGCEDKEVLAGCVGKGRAGEYLAFRSMMNELPDIDQVLMDPDGAPVPDNPSARLLVSMALAARMTQGNFGQVHTYLMRMPQMFRAYAIRDAFKAEAEKKKAGTLPKDHKPLYSSRDFTAWSCSTDGKEIMSAAS